MMSELVLFGDDMKQHLLTLAFLLAALAFYAGGMGSGARFLVLIGFALELWFWVRLSRRKVLAPRKAPVRP